MKKNYLIPASVIVLIITGAWLMWPLTSDKYIIDWDQDLISYKKQLLDSVTDKNDKRDKYPNILLILVDDLGKTDITLYGEGKVHTPNIDQLGMEGVIFEQAYVTSPVCSPSRAAILTGRYPQRFGFTHQMHEFYLENRLMHYGYTFFVDSHPWLPREIHQAPSKAMAARQGLPPSEITLAELLKKEGYRTALIGKWHLGGHPQNIPCAFGFDYQYGFYASHSLYAPEGSEGIVDQRIEDDFSDKHIWSGQRNGPHAIYRNCELIEEKEYLTDAITRECISFIEGNGDSPFFLIASYNAPHSPLQAPEKYVNMFDHIDDPVKRVYYAMIKSLDDNIGDLLAALHSGGLDENTLVFFISDNGGATYTHTTDNAPLKGGKITDFEGGLNVPMILRWDGHCRKGIAFKKPVTSMDIFATITGQLAIELPPDRRYDGKDLVQYISGNMSDKEPHPYIYWNRGDTRAIRSSTYKLVYNLKFGDTLLFDMQKDNMERQNIFVENRETVLELMRVYDLWYKSLPEPLWPPLVYYVYEDESGKYYFDN